jgi:hypothetical protein
MERVVRTLMYHLYHPPISQEALRWTLTEVRTLVPLMPQMTPQLDRWIAVRSA